MILLVSISYVSQFLWPTSIMLTLFSSSLDKKFGPLCLTSSIIHSPCITVILWPPIVCAVGLQMVSLTLPLWNFFQQILWNIMNICIWDVRGQVNLQTSLCDQLLFLKYLFNTVKICMTVWHERPPAQDRTIYWIEINKQNQCSMSAAL